MGKVLRNFNSDQPVKLQLNNTIVKGSLDYILAGLKNNRVVEEVNFT